MDEFQEEFLEEKYITAMEDKYERDVDMSIELTNAFLSVRNELDRAKVAQDEIRAKIIDLRNQGISFPRLSITTAKRKGNVNLKSLCEHYGIMDCDLDEFRAQPSEVVSVKIKK